MSDQDAEFRAFVGEVEPRLRRAFIGVVGVDGMPDAVAEALAYGWEHWARVSILDNPVGYLFRVGQSRSRQPVRHVRLDILNATVDLPVVTFDDQQVAFAVPISDLLDPVTLSFLGENETVLATISLSGMPPYLGGAVGSSIAVSSE